MNNKATLVSLLNHENFAPYHLVHCLFDLSCMLPALHIFVKAIAHHGRHANSCDAKHRFLFDHNTIISAILIFNLMRCRSFAGWLQNMLISVRRYLCAQAERYPGLSQNLAKNQKDQRILGKSIRKLWIPPDQEKMIYCSL